MDDRSQPRAFAPRDKLRQAATLTKSGARRYHREAIRALRGQSPVHDAIRIDPADATAPLAAAWLGHATVLVRLGDRWILTDPVLSHRIGVKFGPITLGVPRLLPAVDPATLPPIDLILLSHAHFDHLDKPTLKKLVSRDTRVVTATGTADLIPRGFGEVHELPWDAVTTLAGVEIRAVRPEHWGARTALDRRRGFNAYLVRADAGRVLFTGDTAQTDAFARVNGADLTIFGIGAYNPWVHAHATPEQAWCMHTAAGGSYLLPMHHSTFKLSDEPAGEPMQRLLAAAGPRAASIVGRTLATFWNRDTHAA
ncbi:MAG: Tat pathway signal protein [Phycisphaerae bacterium]|nr:MAG: Tat pathway signal protein [Phycisphaerae bacterium]